MPEPGIAALAAQALGDPDARADVAEQAAHHIGAAAGTPRLERMMCSTAIVVTHSRANSSALPASSSAFRTSARYSRPTTGNSDRISASLSATFSLARSAARVTYPANRSPRDRVNPILTHLSESLTRGQALSHVSHDSCPTQRGRSTSHGDVPQTMAANKMLSPVQRIFTSAVRLMAAAMFLRQCFGTKGILLGAHHRSLARQGPWACALRGMPGADTHGCADGIG